MVMIEPKLDYLEYVFNAALRSVFGEFKQTNNEGIYELMNGMKLFVDDFGNRVAYNPSTGFFVIKFRGDQRIYLARPNGSGLEVSVFHPNDVVKPYMETKVWPKNPWANSDDYEIDLLTKVLENDPRKVIEEYSSKKVKPKKVDWTSKIYLKVVNMCRMIPI